MQVYDYVVFKGEKKAFKMENLVGSLVNLRYIGTNDALLNNRLQTLLVML